MKVVRVAVVVYENGVEVTGGEVGYYEGQDYAVALETSDGTDWRAERTVGDE